MLITHKGKPLKYKEIARRPKKEKKRPKYIFARIKRECYRPPIEHPFKGPLYRARYGHNPQYSQKEKVAKRKRATTN